MINHPNTITLDTTVGQAVAERPSRARIFELLKIDYCCGGKKTLAEVCRQRGLDAESLIQTLLEDQKPADTLDFASMSLTELADHIEHTHHAYLRTELPRLQAMVEKVASVHGRSYPWMVEMAGIFPAFASHMLMHMEKEEVVLFPAIRNLETGGTAIGCGRSIEMPISVMESEHEEAGEALERFNHLTDGYTPPEDACNTFRAMLDGLRELEADTHQHVHKENNILFPRAIKAFSAQA